MNVSSMEYLQRRKFSYFLSQRERERERESQRDKNPTKTKKEKERKGGLKEQQSLAVIVGVGVVFC